MRKTCAAVVSLLVMAGCPSSVEQRRADKDPAGVALVHLPDTKILKILSSGPDSALILSHPSDADGLEGACVNRVHQDGRIEAVLPPEPRAPVIDFDMTPQGEVLALVREENHFALRTAKGTMAFFWGADAVPGVFLPAGAVLALETTVVVALRDPARKLQVIRLAADADGAWKVVHHFTLPASSSWFYGPVTFDVFDAGLRPIQVFAGKAIDGTVWLASGVGYDEVQIYSLTPDNQLTQVTLDDSKLQELTVGALTVLPQGQPVVVGRRSTGANAWQSEMWPSITERVHLNGMERRSMILAAAALDEDSLAVGGSDGWGQNPDGMSVSDERRAFLQIVRVTGEILRVVDVPQGPRGNEVQHISPREHGGLLVGGIQNGPGSHATDLHYESYLLWTP